MKKYRCSICGYVYDEEKEKVKFSDLPDDWTCPLCGAPKSLFVEVVDENDDSIKEDVSFMKDELDEDINELSDMEISLICSNLARGCEKQYLVEEEKLFKELANHFDKGKKSEGSIEALLTAIDEDIKRFDRAASLFKEKEDRGALRVLTWASKSTNIMNALLKAYKEKGIDYIKNSKIYVCDICGFVYIGEKLIDYCPVCKVPNLKILEVK